MIRKFTRVSLERFLAAHASEERTLDIGSGGSAYDRFFPNRVTVDIDPAREPQVVADAHELPFADESFSLILCTEVLEHLSDPPKAIAEMHRVLQARGKLILTTRFMYPLHDVPHDYFRYTSFGLQHILRDWRDVTIVPEMTTMSTFGVLLQRLVLQSDLRGGRMTKAVFMALALLYTKLDWLVKAEYGDIRHTHEMKNVFSSGYYVTARK